MTSKLIPATLVVWCSAVLVLLAGGVTRAQAAEMKFQATLVWGTDDAKPPPGKHYKPVQPEIKKTLQELPLKWSNWFEVNSVSFAVPARVNKRVAVSAKCELEIRNLDNSEIEVVLIGKGREVVRRKQLLPRGELLALGGNAPHSTAWLVILKRVE